MVVAFDFDKCLSDRQIERLAKKFIENKDEIWVVTMRSDNKFNREILAPVLKRLNLTPYNVIFCADKPKMELIQGIGADIYIDNISEEFENISSYTETIPLLWIN